MTQPRTDSGELHRELIADLKYLRRGPGLQATNLVDRLGPALSAVCYVEPGDPLQEVRRKVQRRLDQLVRQLPNLYRQVARGALNLGNNSANLAYTERLQQLAAASYRDVRTVQRRCDEAMDRLAELAAAVAAHPVDTPWYIDSLRLSMLLDTEITHIYEARRIVATDEVICLDVSVGTQSRSGPDLDAEQLDVEVLHGGEILNVDVSSGKVEARIDFPTPLVPGDTHEVGLLYRIWNGTLRNHYICTPARRCDHLEVMVRFDPAKLPTSVHQVNGAYPKDLATGQAPNARHVDLDARGVVRASFWNPRPGFSYGLTWQPAEPTTYDVAFQ